MKTMRSISKRLTPHDFYFVLFSIVALVPFWTSLRALVSLSLHDDKYSHVVLIPLMAACLVYLQKKRIFTSLGYGPTQAVPLLAAGILLFCLAQTRFLMLNRNDHLSLAVLAIVLVWMAGFVLCYGAQSFHAALFPWLFLLLMVPIPTAAMDKMVLVLQEGSAVLTYALFKALGVPVLWQGFKFSLPGVEIEIAKECSGIRSTFALFITSILAGHMFLESNWRKTFFTLFTIPVAIFKNAVRIVTVSYLGVYVDPAFLHGRLHRFGGLPFSLISLTMLAFLLFALQRRKSCPNERPRANSGTRKGERDPSPLRALPETA